MARTIRDEQLKLTVVINGDAAKNELFELEQSQHKLRNANKELLVEKTKLERQGKKETEQYRQLTTQIKSNNDQLKQNETRMKELRNQIGITGLTLAQLKQKANELRLSLRNMTPGSAEFNRLQAELKQVNTQISKVNINAKATGMSIGKLADGFNKYFTMITAGIATFTGVILGFSQMIKGSGELSDKLADVQKTTGLTAKEVRGLAQDLKSINTRSSRAELLDLARIAGKLGVTGKSDILGFVRAADQLNVALSEDLGGNAEEAIRQVGKLVDVFKVGNEFGLEQGMLKVGSAINALGAASTANEAYLIEFAKRVGGVATQADISIDNVLGLAATLDQLGQTSEVSSTALSKVIVNMFKDTSDYAKIAGISIEEFTQLLNADANEAFIRFLDGLNGNNDGLSVMSKRLDELDLDGSRAIGVLATLSKNTEILRKQQKLSNEEFEKGTSLTNEFNTKNENLAATLDKIGKRLAGMFINSKVMTGIDNMVRGFARLIGVNESQLKIIQREREEVHLLVFELSNANTSEQRRAEILTQLNNISPTLVAGLSSENIEVKKLVTNLKAYNEEALQRLSIAAIDEKTASKMLEVDKLNESRARSFTAVGEAMMQMDQELATSNKDIDQKFSEFEKILNEHYKEQYQIMKDNEMIINGQIVHNLAYDAASQKLLEIGTLMKNINNYRVTGVQLEQEGNILEEYEKQKESLRAILNIKRDVNLNIPDDQPTEEPTFTSTGDTKAFQKELEERKKLLQDYYSSIEKLIDDNFAKSLSKSDQELLAIDRKYEDLYAKAQAAGQSTEELQLMHAEELALKQKEIEELTQQEILNIKQKYGIDVTEELMNIELDQLQLHYEQKLLNEEEFQAAKANIEEKYSQISDKKSQSWEQKRFQSEKDIIDARIRMREAATNAFITLVGQESAVGTALFLFQKAFAIADIIKSASVAKAQIAANLAAIPRIVPPGLPNPMFGLALASSAAQQAALKASTIANIAEIVATTIPKLVTQFASGKYDVIGDSDGIK
ncbi:MAG TPA: phage tail tape measure protein [Bacteroidales bacterium]|nr:phage tail tape measure protein [Bacteroidales bacterium]